MYKTSIYTLVNGDMQWVTHRKQQLRLNNITFFSDFCCFRCVTHCMSPLTSVLTDVLYIYICCFITITKLLCWNHLLSTAMKTRNLKYFGVTILIFRNHVTSSVTWPSDSAWALSYWWSMIAMRLSWTDTDIQSFKDFGVTSLTFWGHVTSSVTWPFDSAYVVSYWWSIGTMCLSCTVTEI